MAKEEFPKVLHHPHFRKGVAKPIAGTEQKNQKGEVIRQDFQGEPDLFPDVAVNNSDQEAFYRAKGYLVHGEAPPPPADYSEYPVMLSHPEHVEAVPDTTEIKKNATTGQPETFRITGTPEKFPPVMAKDAAEEKKWVTKGYKRIGKADGEASQRAKASPFDPNYKLSEYPKFVDGVIVDPHATLDHNRYPMWVGDVLVNSAEEERAARGIKADAPVLPAEKCVICGGPIIAADGGWGNGAAGPFHLAHLSGKESKTPEADKAKRAEAGKKAAETRKRKKERAGQAASQGG